MNRAILTVLLLQFFMGCVHVMDSAETKYDDSRTNIISEKWLQVNRDELTEKITDRIVSRYPDVEKGFPRILVEKVDVRFNAWQAGSVEGSEQILTEIFRDVLARVYAESSSNANIRLRLVVSRHDAELSKLEKMAVGAYVVPGTALCFSTLFLVCPVKDTDVFKVKVYFPDDQATEITGLGAATLLQSTVVINDNPDLSFTGEGGKQMKAIISAVVDATEKTIAYLSSNENM